MNRLSDAQPPASSPMSDADADVYLGKVLGRYRVGSMVAGAQKYRVYRAHDLNTNAEARVKVLIRGMEADSSVVERSISEAHRAGTLGHPNIAASLEAGTARDGAPFYVTEVLSGQPLDQLVVQSGQFQVPRALGIVTQLASALRAAHEQGIIHGYVSPMSVIVSGSPDAETVKLCDFGLTPFHGIGRGLGRFLGAPNWMAPEQMADAPQVDARADVYALGALLYTMLAGDAPFAKVSARDLPRAIAEEEPAKLRRFRPELRVSLIQVVNRAMRKLRDDRFQSVQELLDALARLEVAPAGAGALPAAPISSPSITATPAPVTASAAPASSPSPSPVPTSPFAATMVASSELAVEPAAAAPPPAVVQPYSAVVPALPSTAPQQPVSVPVAPPAPALEPTTVAPAAVNTAVSAVPAAPNKLPVDTLDAQPPEKRKSKALFLVPLALVAGVALTFAAMRGSGTTTTTQSAPQHAAIPQAASANTTTAPVTTKTEPVKAEPEKLAATPTKSAPDSTKPQRTQEAPTRAVTRAPAPVAPRPPPEPKPTPVAAAPAPVTPAPAPTPTFRKPRTSAELEPEEYFEEYPQNAKKK